MFQLRQDLHFPRHVLQSAPFRAFVFMYVLHSVHIPSTVTFLHDAYLIVETAFHIHIEIEFHAQNRVLRVKTVRLSKNFFNSIHKMCLTFFFTVKDKSVKGLLGECRYFIWYTYCLDCQLSAREYFATFFLFYNPLKANWTHFWAVNEPCSLVKIEFLFWFIQRRKICRVFATLVKSAITSLGIFAAINIIARRNTLFFLRPRT